MAGNRKIRLRAAYRIAVAVVVLLLIFYLVYEFYLLHGPRQAHYHRAGSISLAGEKLGGLELLQDISRLNRGLSPDMQTEQYEYYSLSSGLAVAVRIGEGRIVRITSTLEDVQVKTSRGIGAGDTRTEVLQAYGEAFYKREEQGALIIGYIDKTLHYTLEFWFHDEQVQQIRYDLDEMR